MADSTATTDAPHRGVEIVAYDEFVKRQLGRVQNHVRASEVLTAWLRWTVSVLAVLAAIVITDHWIADVGRFGRTTVGLAWCCWSIWLFLRRVIPPMRRRINTAYAAKVVEEAEPGLKNGLINLVFLRRRANGANEVVLRELEQQTARTLTTVPVETAIDRSSLIRWLLALSLLIVAWAAYAAFSPKSTFDSLRRWLIPMSNTARPSRVRILEVQPGDATTYYGRGVLASAHIDNLRDDDAPLLVYTTDDRQAVEQALVMKGTDKRDWFAVEFPDHANGATSNITYTIRAGDAVAGPFHIRVLELPSAVVERVRYTYPAYTGLEPKEVEREGNLSALEGTKVTWWIRTNHPIEQAFIEFDPLPETGEAPTLDHRWPLTDDERSATGNWTLTLQSDRVTPTYASYQIRFRSVSGVLNPEPVVYNIDVAPDLSPLVEILKPDSREVQLPENRQMEIEVRGLDPDFSLSQLRLVGLCRGQTCLQAELLHEATTGQVIRRYRLEPRKLGLRAGDVLVYWGEAHDNRHDPVTQSLAANIERTVQYRVTILPPDAGDESTPPSDQESTDNAQNPATPQEEGQGDAGDAGESSNADQADDSGPGDSGLSNDNGESNSEGDASKSSDQSSDGEATTSKSRETGEGDSQDGVNDGSDTDESTSTGDRAANQEGRDQQGSEPKERGQSSSDAKAGDGTDDAEQGNASSSSQASSDDAGQGEPNQSERGAGSGSMTRDDGESLPSDGSRDGDAFERILDQMRKDQNSSKGPSDAQHTQEGTDGDDADAQPTKSTKDDGSTKSTNESDPTKRGSKENKSSTPRQGTEEDPGSATDPGRPTDEPSSTEPDSQDFASEPRDGTDDASATEQEQPSTPDNSETTDSQSQKQSASNAESSGDANRDNRTGQQESSQGRPADSSDASSGDRPQDATNSSRSNQQTESSQDGGSENTNSADSDGSSEIRPSDSSTAESSERMGGSDAPPSDGDNASRGTAQTAGPPPSTDSAEDWEDEANLDYARKATDLALEYLKRQREQPDPALLDRLGWTPQELQQFIRRWEKMRAEATEPGDAGENARRQLDDLLKGLGLVPQQDRVRQRVLQNRRVEGVLEDGDRSQPPVEYREYYRAYMKSRQSSGTPDAK